MSVAVLIVSHRSEAHIGPCLRSVINDQHVDEIVVWDNASADRSADAAAATAPDARVIRCLENLGFAAAVNRAAQVVPRSDLLLLNPDAVLRAGSTAALTSALALHPGMAVVGARLVDLDGGRQPDAWAFPTPGRAIIGSVIGLGRAYRPQRRHAGDLDCLGNAFVPFTAALLRRSVFDDLGGLDEAFWMYGEDSEYCYRAGRAGWTIGVADGATARHVGGASSAPAARAEAVLSGGDRFRDKHFSFLASRAAASALHLGALVRLVWAAAASRVAEHPRSREEWRNVRRHYRS